MPPDEVAGRARAAIAAMGGRFLLLGPDCSVNPDTPDAVFHAAGAVTRAVPAVDAGAGDGPGAI
jgi:hypothetical protein